MIVVDLAEQDENFSFQSVVDLLELKKLRLIACILRISPCTSGRLGIKLKVGKKLRLFIMDSGDFMSVRK